MGYATALVNVLDCGVSGPSPAPLTDVCAIFAPLPEPAAVRPRPGTPWGSWYDVAVICVVAGLVATEAGSTLRGTTPAPIAQLGLRDRAASSDETLNRLSLLNRVDDASGLVSYRNPHRP